MMDISDVRESIEKGMVLQSKKGRLYFWAAIRRESLDRLVKMGYRIVGENVSYDQYKSLRPSTY